MTALLTYDSILVVFHTFILLKIKSYVTMDILLLLHDFNYFNIVYKTDYLFFLKTIKIGHLKNNNK